MHSHLEGGMKYSHGHLIVPEDGEYYVYAQLYFRSGGRVLILKNHIEVMTMLQHPHNVPEGPQYVGGAFYPEAGDTIALQTTTHVTLYMSTAHSYFGAFPDTVSSTQSRKSLEGYYQNDFRYHEAKAPQREALADDNLALPLIFYNLLR